MWYGIGDRETWHEWFRYEPVPLPNVQKVPVLINPITPNAQYANIIRLHNCASGVPPGRRFSLCFYFLQLLWLGLSLWVELPLVFISGSLLKRRRELPIYALDIEWALFIKPHASWFVFVVADYQLAKSFLDFQDSQRNLTLGEPQINQISQIIER